MFVQLEFIVIAVFCIRYAESNSNHVIMDPPKFSCETMSTHNSDPMVQMDDTDTHRYLIDQIIGMVAWDYKRHYSWVIQGQKYRSTMDLHYCVDEHGIVGLNAQKYDYSERGEGRGDDFIYFCIEFPVDCGKNAPKITVDGTAEVFDGKYYQVIDFNTYHAFRFFPSYQWLKN